MASPGPLVKRVCSDKLLPMTCFLPRALRALCPVVVAMSTVACGSGQEQKHTESAPAKDAPEAIVETSAPPLGPAPRLHLGVDVQEEGVQLRVENHDAKVVYVSDKLTLQLESNGRFERTEATLSTRASCGASPAPECRALVPGAALVPANVRTTITGDAQCSPEQPITAGTFKVAIAVCDASGKPSGHTITSDSFTITDE